MQHDHSITDPKKPNYDFHLPKNITYPIPVGIVSIALGSLLFFFLRETTWAVSGRGRVSMAVTFLFLRVKDKRPLNLGSEPSLPNND